MAMSSERRAAMTASLVAGSLVVAKMVAGLLSGSVAVLASAIDSALDLAVSGFNLFAIASSEKPASERFNYGLGKIEGLASAIEGTIIIMSGLFILYQAIARAIRGAPVSHLDVSLGVMLASMLVTALLVLYLGRVARITGNMVVKADALHYRTDLWANGGILLSLLLVRISGLDWIDALVGAVIAIYIIYSAYSILREGVLNLLDVALDPQMVEHIRRIIREEKNVSSIIFCAPGGQEAIISSRATWFSGAACCSMKPMRPPTI